MIVSGKIKLLRPGIAAEVLMVTKSFAELNEELLVAGKYFLTANRQWLV